MSSIEDLVIKEEEEIEKEDIIIKEIEKKYCFINDKVDDDNNNNESTELISYKNKFDDNFKSIIIPPFAEKINDDDNDDNKESINQDIDNNVDLIDFNE